MNTGVLCRPQLGERLLKIKPFKSLSVGVFREQYSSIISVISMDASSRPVSRGVVMLPVNWTGGRGTDRPASTSGQTGINLKSLPSFSMIRELGFAWPS